VPIDVPAQQQACRTGALSEQECRIGFAVRWRRHGQPGLAGGLEAGLDRGLGQGLLPPPISVPVSALMAGGEGSFSLSSVFRVTPRPLPLAGNGDRLMLFPVVGSAITTSTFGYRLHPLLGSWLMHAGRDLAAPEGTPVLASLSGRVMASGPAGGYGLAVELEHRRPLRRTLYGHLSELYVRPGDWVRQGEVIGRVGSTGLSSGPHLHFEVRQPADGGWVAVEPGELDPGRGLSGRDAVAQLMGQLLQSLERPKTPAKAG
jgi:murein DD-endopeptidase MepM/ murein hydrolase activator NlpD